MKKIVLLAASSLSWLCAASITTNAYNPLAVDATSLLPQPDITVQMQGYYYEQNVMSAVNGLLQHDIGAAITELETYPLIPVHSQETRDTFSAIKALPSTLATDNNIEGSTTAAVHAKYENFNVSVLKSTRINTQVYLNPNFNRLIIKTSDTIPSYLEYDPASDTTTPVTSSDYTNSSFIYAIKNGLDYLKTKGVTLIEIPISYSYQFENFDAKVTASTMYGTTFSKNLNFLDISSSVATNGLLNAFDALVGDTKQSEVAFNASLSARYYIDGLGSIGVDAINLTTPTFTTINSESIEYSPQATLVANYEAMEDMNIHATAELMQAKTLIPNYNTQYISLNASYSFASWAHGALQFRKNIAHSEEGLISGIAMRLGGESISMRLDAEASSSGTTVNGVRVPTYASGTLSIIGRW